MKPARLLIRATALLVCSCSSPAPEVTKSPLLGAACDESGHACTWLGLPGQDGYNGDGHRREETKIYWSMDMAFGADGSAWFIDWNNHMVRRVLPDQTVETALGSTEIAGFPGDGGPGENTAEGALGTTVALNHPTDLAIDRDGTLLVMAWHNHKLRELNPETLRAHIECGAGPGFRGDGLPAREALFRQPKALELGPAGERYIVDQQNFRIRRIDTNGIIETIAGSGTQGDGSVQGDGGPAKDAHLSLEAGSNPEPSGGIALAGNKLYFADTLANRVRVIDLDSGNIAAFAGTGEGGYSGDGGPAAQATLYRPRDLEIGPEGDLYVADTDNNVVRAISAQDGSIRTVVGTGVAGLALQEGQLATQTLLHRPFGIDFDPEGNLYVSDTLNSRIVRVQR
jgi:DNA-binding beta-propeller fold protein YncE